MNNIIINNSNIEKNNKNNRMKQNKIFGSGLSHTKKERIHGEVHTEYVLNPFSGKWSPWLYELIEERYGFKPYDL
jgi:hypothetical protein